VALIEDVKCGNCDKYYSALRARCPYCGARRGSVGKHSNERDNIKGKVIVGSIFLVVILAATTVLLIVSSKNNPNVVDPPSITTPNLPDEGDVDSIINPEWTPDPIIEDTPTPTPPPVLESVKLTYAGTEIAKDSDGVYDFREKVGTTLKIGLRLSPADIEGLTITWESSDASVFDVVPAADGLSAQVTMLSAGTAKLTVTVNGITVNSTVRVRA